MLPALKGAELQLGCVVPDAQAASVLWGAMLGIGPWIAVDDYSGYQIHWGGRDLDIRMTNTFSYFGDVQVELIQPHRDVESPHRAYLDGGGSGLHHLGFFVDDYAAAVAAADAANLKTAFEVSAPGAANRTVYYEAPPEIGCFIEIIDLPPERRTGFHAIKEAAASWDGTRPFRKYHRLAEFLAEQDR